MSSTFRINFSLRQNKAIERAIVFDALRQALPFLGERPAYVGLGSVWFQDFQLAHRVLGIAKMISIEGEPSVFARAQFNRPYACIEVLEGWTGDVLPELIERPDLRERAWITWLDYDKDLDRGRLDELMELVRRLPEGSAVLATFNATPSKYARETDERRRALVDLFGEDITGELADEDLRGHAFMSTLAQCVMDSLVAAAIRSGRQSGFVPALRLLYRDSANMATVGGFIPSAAAASKVRELVGSDQWFGFEDTVIATQPLTLREIYALWQLLPTGEALTVEQVAELGLKLDEEQLRFFERHYLRYPTYAEIT